ncbi:MAG: NUDIX domain-containing protein [Prevotellaceae bacterium]|jgi:8-oxo-dGTP pyrophosphatase MutT (NUDIX family)|nr:NUDIX domain-containing protein [Prevotellaceae bacterium]
MVKIFFNDRLLALSGNWTEGAADVNAIMRKVTKKSDIATLVTAFLETAQWRALYLISDPLPALLEEVKKMFTCVEAAGGMVRKPSGEVLMIYRNNRWDLPKGHREANESLEETALREVEEECGIGGLQLLERITATYHIYCDNENTVLKRTEWYAMNYTGTATPAPQTIEGITQAEWKPLSELPAILPTVYCSIYEVFCAAGINGERSTENG